MDAPWFILDSTWASNDAAVQRRRRGGGVFCPNGPFKSQWLRWKINRNTIVPIFVDQILIKSYKQTITNIQLTLTFVRSWRCTFSSKVPRFCAIQRVCLPPNLGSKSDQITRRSVDFVDPPDTASCTTRTLFTWSWIPMPCIVLIPDRRVSVRIFCKLPPM